MTQLAHTLEGARLSDYYSIIIREGGGGKERKNTSGHLRQVFVSHRNAIIISKDSLNTL